MMTLSDHVALATQLRDRLLAGNIDADDVGEGDNALLHDMVEGETDLLEILARIARSARQAKAYGEACASMIEDMRARKTRHEARAERLRGLILWAMQEVGIPKHEAPDLTISVTKPRPGVVITNEGLLPFHCIKTVTSPDRAAIKAALEAGEEVPGAELQNGAPSLTIRTK